MAESDREGNRQRINVSADIDNRSSEPAHYSSYRLYFDVNFRARVIGGFKPHGKKAPKGEPCNAFVRQMMVPTDFPVIKEQTNRIITLALDLPLDTPTSRFVIGSSIRAPGCERDAWETIYLKDVVAILGPYKTPLVQPMAWTCSQGNIIAAFHRWPGHLLAVFVSDSHHVAGRAAAWRRSISEAHRLGAGAQNRSWSSIWRAPDDSPRRAAPAAAVYRIDLQYDLGDLSPIGAVVLGVKQAQIRDEVLFVVPGQIGISRR